MRDEEIVDMFFMRSEKAIEETQAKYGKYCAYIAGNILTSKEDIEECVNEVLSAAWNSIPPKKPENLKTYVGKLTRRISISRWRKNHAGKRAGGEFALSLEEIHEVADFVDPAMEAEKQELSNAISDFLRTLPETERNLMIRRYWFNDSIRCIAARYGFREGKVKVSLQRSRKKLKEYLEKEGLAK